MDIFNKTILLTGGTGSFGREFVSQLLNKKKFTGILRIYSRDEFKQFELARTFKNDKRLRFFIGDIRDNDRLQRATEGVEILVHAAALKQVPILEYNPFEAVKTNIIGTQNVINAAIDNNVKRAIFISSDKAVNPVNLYGATKMVAEKLFVQGNSYVGPRDTRFSVVRYGNVVGSRGSVIPLFLEQAEKNSLTITDERMTRFWITLSQGVNFVIKCIEQMNGGEIFVPKIPSFKIMDLARTLSPKGKLLITGIRPGEKIHETLVGADEARHTLEFSDYFMVEPEFTTLDRKATKPKEAKELALGYSYNSEENTEILTATEIKNLIKNYVQDKTQNRNK